MFLILQRLIVFVFTAALAPSLADAGQREMFAGPVEARVMRVVDGDTIAVRAQIWIGQTVEVLVRVRGIDAPERKSRCGREKRMAARATAYVRAMTASGRVVLTDISGGKYFGRVLADVATTEGNDVAGALLGHKLVRPYQGRKRQSWCGLAKYQGGSGAKSGALAPLPVRAER